MKVSLARRIWVGISAAVVGFFAFVVNRCRIAGAEQVPKSGGVLFLSNHISAFDTVVLPAAIQKSRPWQMVWAPAKEELFRNRFLGAIFRSWGAFPIRRGRDLKAGKELGRLLKDSAVMLFPEGTRHKDGQLGAGNRGVGKLIYDHRPVVIPVSLSGLNHWRVGATGQQADICFGQPLDCTDLFELPDEKQTHILIVERVMEQIGQGLKSAPEVP